MGWFGRNSKKEFASSDYVQAQGAEVEDGALPIAVAIRADSPTVSPSRPPPINPAYMVVQQQPHHVQVLSSPSVMVPPPATPLPPPPPPPVLLYPVRSPISMRQCPSCMQRGRTRIRTAPDIVTWLTVVVMLFVFWPLCWIPLVTDCMKRTDHYCVQCHNLVASVRPYQDCCVKHRS